MRRSILTCLLLLLATPAFAQDPPPSVIYFVGDGMGPTQVTLGRRAAQAKGEPYHLRRFPVIGKSSTRAADYLVTDSAAAGTALACGVKTNNHVVGLDPSGAELKTILDLAHAKGYRTGVVTNTRVTHATPAAFLAHVESRQSEREIAEQIVAQAETEGYPQVVIGGGRRNFSQARRDRLEAAGYVVGTSIPSSGDKVFSLLAASHMPYQTEGGTSLRTLLSQAVSLLERSNQPFFLVVEGGRIDHACHVHDVTAMVGEQLDFDKAVGWALDRAEQDPTLLVLATADHATGNLGITENTDVDAILDGGASAEAMLARARTGLMSGLDPAQRDAALQAEIQAHYGVTLTAEELQLINRSASVTWARLALGHILSARNSVTWYDPLYQEFQLRGTHGHTGEDVEVFAFGPGAERFGGSYENTQIPHRLAALLGGSLDGSASDSGDSSQPPVPGGGALGVDLVISEVCWEPVVQRSGEFIELLNTSGAAIDLSGYQIEDDNSRDVLRAYESGSTVLQPGELALIVDPDFDDDFVIPADVVVVTVGNRTLGNGLRGGELLKVLTPAGDVIHERRLEPATPRGESLHRNGSSWEVGAATPGR